MEGTRRAFDKWLSLSSHDLVDVVAAAVIANRLPGDPLWLAIVGPPASGKTEVLRALRGLDRVVSLDAMSPATLLSGYRTGKKSQNHSLLAQLTPGVPWILNMEDFTLVLSQPWHKRGEILSQLRKLYDGDVSARWGNDQSIRVAGQGGAGRRVHS
jgi:hypothetical protein